jgi:hypothetical protein
MLEPKQDLSAADVSQAPTIVPSAASVSDFEKDRASSRDREETILPATKDETAPETGSDGIDLAKAATAASQAHGQSLKEIQTREDGTEYPTGMKLGLINLALCLSVFLMALGMSCASFAEALRRIWILEGV